MTIINIKDKISSKALVTRSRERYLALECFFEAVKEYVSTVPVGESIDLRNLIAKAESDIRMKSLD
jgi:hypothetical protein